MDHVRRSYAALGLPHGSSYATVRRRYRALVKTWHPDRFAGDPQGQAEATLRMRVINDAYETLMRQPLFAKSSLGSAHAKAQSDGQHRLSREQIDAMVAAIGSEGPLDGFLGAVGWAGSTVSAVFTALFLLGLVFRITVALFTWNWRDLHLDSESAFLITVLIILGVKEYLQRRRLAAVVRGEAPSVASLPPNTR
jgi:DnaJ domain